MSRDAQGRVREEERCPLCYVWHNRPWQEIHKQELASSDKTNNDLDRVIN
jgi:hypothetical protein